MFQNAWKKENGYWTYTCQFLLSALASGKLTGKQAGGWRTDSWGEWEKREP